MLKKYKLIFIAIFVILSGCTNNSSTPSPKSESQSLTAQGDGNFGVVEFNKSLVKSFTFKNDSAGTLSLTPEILGGNFEQLSLGCQTMEPGRSCLVKVVFNANKESGVYSGQLKVGNLILPLSAEITSVPEVSYQFFIDGQEVSGNIGSISGNNIKLMNVKIKNNSPKTGGLSSLISSSNKFTFLYNSCTGIKLKPTQSCLAKIMVQADNTATELATTLSFDNYGPAIALTQEVVDLASHLQPIISSVTLGDIYKEGEDRIQVLTVENKGKSVGTISNIDVPPGFTVLNNGCLSVKPGHKCLIRVGYRTSDIPKGQYTNQIDLGDDASIEVKVNQVTNPNKLDRIELSGASDVLINTCTPVVVSLKDVDNLDYITSQTMALVSNESLYQDSNCLLTDSSLAAFEPSKTFYLKKSTVGSFDLQISYAAKAAQKNINWYNSLSAVVAPIIITHQPTNISVAGGKPPYQYSVLMGSGEVSPLGIYQSDNEGDMIVKIEDSLHLVTTVAIKVVKPLQLVAQKNTQVVATNQIFSVTGGLAPFTYSVTGGGSINATTGEFTAPAVPGSVTLRVTDNSGQSAEIIISIVSVLTINPTTTNILINTNSSFVGGGGLPPYVYSVTGGGSINPSSGEFTAPSTAGTSTIKVTDSIGQIATATVTVVNPLTLSAAKDNQVVNTQQTITASGGLTPYVYSVKTGLGSVNSASGIFTAAGTAGSVTLKVTDNSGQSAEVSVNVVPLLTISPTAASVIVSTNTNFTGIGGLTPYAYSIVSGGGAINSTNGIFTAPNTAATVTVRVTDALNQTAEATVSVASNITISAGNCSYSVPESMTCTVSSSGGIGSRTYSTNVGTINSSTGVFKGSCVNNVGSSVVTVTDQYSNSAQVTLTYPCVYQSCNQIKADVSGAISAVYWIDLDGLSSGNDPFQVYCNQDLEQGGWTLVANIATTSTSYTTTPSSALSGGNPNYSSNYNLYQLFPTFNSTNKMVTINGTTQVPGMLVPDSANNRWSSNTLGNTSPAYYPYIQFITSPGYIYGWGFSPTQIGLPNVGRTTWCSSDGLYLYFNADGIHPGVSSWQAGCNSGAYWKNNFSWQLYDKMTYYKLPTSCLDAKNKGVLNKAGTTGSGIYTLDLDGYGQGNPPFDAYCDQSTDSGGWQLVAAAWIPAYAANESSAMTTIGQFIYSNGDVRTPAFKEMRHYCRRSDGGIIHRKRTYSTTATTKNLYIFDGNAYAGTDTLLTGHNTSATSNWTQNGSYTELHYYHGDSNRFIIRTSDVHCGLNYSVVGGENNNPALGQEGMIFVR